MVDYIMYIQTMYEQRLQWESCIVLWNHTQYARLAVPLNTNTMLAACFYYKSVHNKLTRYLCAHRSRATDNFLVWEVFQSLKWVMRSEIWKKSKQGVFFTQHHTNYVSFFSYTQVTILVLFFILFTWGAISLFLHFFLSEIVLHIA